MKKHYYVNSVSQPNGDHEVHCEGCYWMPSITNRIYLGYFASSREALNAAKLRYPLADGCAFCCPDIHKH